MAEVCILMQMRLLDRYALRLTLWPMLGALSVTLVALLLERVLRLLDLLSQSSDRFGFVMELTANLVPHYLGLTLPAAFFVALFIVAARLNDGSEIDAMLASGQSLTRLTAPYVCLGAALMMVSLILFGFIQPYSRYAYRAVLHSAQEAGWSGRVEPGTIVAAGNGVTITADRADVDGRSLEGVFIRRLSDDGTEEITTARTAELRTNPVATTATLVLHQGQMLRINPDGQTRTFAFNGFFLDVPLSVGANILRGRGGDEREMTLIELVDHARSGTSLIPAETLMAEFYGRLARALSLPLLPLLALPLGLAAKRSGRAPGVIIAGIILIAFQHLLQLGQGLAESGRAAALPAVGLPFIVFVGLCLWIFAASRNRPGDTPISRIAQGLGRTFRNIGAMLPKPMRQPA